MEVFTRNERVLWIGAFVLYGVGDTVTTFVGLSVGGVAEVGPIAGPAMEAAGPGGLLAVKVAIFATFGAFWSLLITPGRAAIPLALTVVGGLVTAWNLLVITTSL